MSNEPTLWAALNKAWPDNETENLIDKKIDKMFDIGILIVYVVVTLLVAVRVWGMT